MDTTQRLSQIVDPTIFEITDQTKDQLSANQEWKTIGYDDFHATVPAPRFSATSGLSAAQLTLQGLPYKGEDRTQGYPITITVLKWTKMCTYTEELIHWVMEGNKDRVIEFKEDAEAVMHSLYERLDTQAARMIYLAHTTTHQTGGDSVALAAYNHPSTEPGIATQRNIFLTTEGQRALAYDSIKDARVRLNRFFDLKGVQMNRSMQIKLLIPQELEDDANRYVRAEKKPGTNFNDPNTLNAIKIQVVSWQPSTYSTYWALVAEDRQKRGTKMVNGWMPKIDQETEFRSGTFFKTGSVYFQTGFRDWQWGFFSKGDSSVIAN